MCISIPSNCINIKIQSCHSKFQINPNCEVCLTTVFCIVAKMTVLSAQAYCKMMLHAAKYPHCAINGLLLAKPKSKGDKSADWQIEDAMPLFHLCLHVSPMAEIALNMVNNQTNCSKNMTVDTFFSFLALGIISSKSLFELFAIKSRCKNRMCIDLILIVDSTN